MAALTCVLLVTACARSTPSGRVTVDLPTLDARLAAPCARPGRLAGDLTADQVKAGWARDRAALASCGDEKAAIVEGYDRLRSEIGGGK